MKPLAKPASQEHGSLSMQVKAVGVWTSQFSQEQLDSLAERLIGKSRQQALSILLHTPGIQQVSFAPGNETLPADAAHIHLAVLYTA